MDIRLLKESVATAAFAASEDRFKDNPIAAPMFGLTRMGDIDKTIAPEPVGVVDVLIEIFPEDTIGEFEIVNKVDNEVIPIHK